MTKKKRGRKLTKAERRAIAMRNLAKAHRGRRKSRKAGYKPRSLSRRRFKKKRVGLKRFGRNRGEAVKVLTTGERRRRRSRSKRKNPWHGEPRRHAKAAKKGWRGRRRRNGVKRKRSSGRHKGTTLTKRQRAARKAARTRKRNKAERSAAARKAARSRKRGGSKRRSSAKRASKRSPTGHRKSPKRVRAAKKAARTRKRNKSRNKRAYARAGGRRYTPPSHQLAAEGRRRRRRKGRRKNPIEVHGSIQRNPRRRHYRRRNPLVNPLPNPLMDASGFLSKALGLGIGFLMQDAIDRFGATHSLTADTSGNVTDTPTAGQIYDSEAVQLPIWSSTTRLAYNAAGLAIPGLLGRFFWPDFWNFAFAAAVVRVIGKVATSAVAQFAPADSTTLRLYGDAYAANARLQQAAGSALTQAQAGTFAGVPRGMRGGPAPRQLAAPPQRTLGDCGCSNGFNQLMTDPLQSAQGIVNTPFGMSEDPCCFNPLTAGTGPDQNVFPQPVTPQPVLSPITPTPSNTVVSPLPPAPTPNPNPGCDPNRLAGLWSGAMSAMQSGDMSTYNFVAGQLQACGVTPPVWNPPAPSSPAPTPTPSPTPTPAPGPSLPLFTRSNAPR